MWPEKDSNRFTGDTIPGRDRIGREYVEIITTHINADFDAMASMIAAKKLYPEAAMVFPGSQERNLREFFVESTFYFFDFARIRDLDFEKIRRLILVDTRQEWEYRTGHIKGAVNFPMEPTWWYRWRKQGELKRFLGPDKDRFLVFY